MHSEKSETLPIRTEANVVEVRTAVRRLAGELKFNLVDQTKVVTAASELARNTLLHGGGGQALLELIADEEGRRGIRLIFSDQGPGIADIDQAMSDGFTSRGGLGLGLGGSKRLSHEFDVDSTPGAGTRVTFVRWK